MTNPSLDIATPAPPSDAATPAPEKLSNDTAAKPEQEKPPQKKTKSATDRVDPAVKGALDKLDGLFQRSLGRLKAMHGADGLRRLWKGNRYVYALPWYMVIGKRGVGKTHVLLNSGLTCPPSDRLTIAPGLSTEHGHADHCEWWLSDSAVLIDTAGRYFTQQADAVTDNAEWHGFLGLLRKYRRRTPINGAMLTLDVGELLTQSESDRLAFARQLRARLHDLRAGLGIRFPVYVIVTKMDVLKGFTDYFHSFTSECRAQAWGFTLPYVNAGDDNIAESTALHGQLLTELQMLSRRLEDGLQGLLRKETDHDRRRALSALPLKFDSLISPLASIIDAIFLYSRFDETQTHHTLRGVYFTSAVQGGHTVPADRLQPLQRQLTAECDDKDDAMPATNDACRAALPAGLSHGNRGYFLNDLFSRIIIPEAHLARPNLRWVRRLRLLRRVGHVGVAIIGMWLVAGMFLSFGHNSAYLHAIADKAALLKQRMSKLLALPDAEKILAVPDALTTAQELPLYGRLDINDPSTGFGYGLYSASPVAEAAHDSYTQLEDRLLLPQIVKRMEDALTVAIRNQDAKAAYDTLRVYL